MNTGKSWKISLTLSAIALIAITDLQHKPTWAVSPASIQIGRQLFERDWTPNNPALVGNDGLGPLFNGNSCVACHHQKGIGGGGEAEFNAKTISISSMRVTGPSMNQDIVRQAIRGFHPGFIDPRAGIVNSLSLHHHGGTAQFAESRKRFMEKIPAVFSENGGAKNAAEVRRANSTPILYTANDGAYQTTIHAHMFQRNTPALFGAGLIDQVDSKTLRGVEREQKGHPEISGRIATLPNGRIGRFGWRGNVPTLLNFCDQACAAEVGLETRRISQPADPMAPTYRNPTHDISDDQIRAMAAFVAALPAPVRMVPQDSEKRQLAMRGEQIFASIGCAVCHRPDIGPAKGAYTDMLLHDMGPKSYDLNPADPYIERVTPVTKVQWLVDSTTTQTDVIVSDTVMGTAYYGGNYSMEPGESRTTTLSSTNPGGSGRSMNRNRLRRNRVITPPTPNRSSVSMTPKEYRFHAQPIPPMTMRFVDVESNTQKWSEEKSGETQRISQAVVGNEQTASGSDTYLVDRTVKTSSNITRTQQDYKRIHMKPTYFTQEWRTPPLWGVNDSAPYMHDGRAETLLEAVTMHEGESKGTRDRFLALPLEDRQALIEFLRTLVAPPNMPQLRS